MTAPATHVWSDDQKDWIPIGNRVAVSPEVESLLRPVVAQRNELRASLAELVRLHDTAGGWAEHTQAVDRARDLLDRIPPAGAR